MKQGEKKMKKAEGRGDMERKISGVMNHGESEGGETSGKEQEEEDNNREDKITPFCCLDLRGKACARGSGEFQLSEPVLVPQSLAWHIRKAFSVSIGSRDRIYSISNFKF
jgi:hypothetical protein